MLRFLIKFIIRPIKIINYDYNFNCQKLGQKNVLAHKFYARNFFSQRFLVFLLETRNSSNNCFFSSRFLFKALILLSYDFKLTRLNCVLEFTVYLYLERISSKASANRPLKNAINILNVEEITRVFFHLYKQVVA